MFHSTYKCSVAVYKCSVAVNMCHGAVMKVFRSSYGSVPEQLVSLPEQL